MERSSLLKWLLIGAAVFLFMQYGLPAIRGDSGGGSSEKQPLNIVETTAPKQRTAETTCDIKGERFKAQLTSKGGAFKHVLMEDAHYTREKDGTEEPIDLVTTELQAVMPLRTNFRLPCARDGDKCTALGTADQVAYDDFDWEIESRNSKSCTFVYSDEKVALKKTITATERPFELTVRVDVTNKDKAAQKHRFTVEQSDWRIYEETKGSLGRLSEFTTQVEARGTETERLTPDDFEPAEFAEEGFTEEKWKRVAGAASWAAVSNSYFSKAIFHVKAPDAPFGETQIEHVWDESKFKNKDKDPGFGHIYRARLSYPTHELQPGAKASYQLLAYVGPKERNVLATVGKGEVQAIEILDLGMFGFIGKYLILYLYWLYGFTKTWGWAICLLTITVKLLLFPLSITQIKSSMAMRKLKPEMDELNKKYKDDATQRGLATQELWRKNKVTNPMLGCLPVLLQMPVWFALYTALQSAVELYHVPFAWFPDLSAPDGYYVLPVLLGASSLLQQYLMPMQGDAMQQKMMRYMMPAMFTVFMLFLPAGLGIYFLTNTWLGIGQQLLVERYYKSQEGKKSGDEKDEKKTEGAKGANTKRGKAETA